MAFDDYPDPRCQQPDPPRKERGEYECPECGSSNSYNVTFPDFRYGSSGCYVRGCRSCGATWDEYDRCTG